MEVTPIGYFYSDQKEKYAVPRQPGVIINSGMIRLNPNHDFEQALEGLQNFERIWVLFHFHQNTNWKPKVMPPRGDKKQGVFATRSPHRPNFIGLSCVELVSIEGLDLHIINHDLIDHTPILDIKPYLNYADSFHCERQGWLDELEQESVRTIEWSALASEQIDYLCHTWKINLKELIEMRLRTNPKPSNNNRIREIKPGIFELGCKTWRIAFRMNEDVIHIENLYSGYDLQTLNGEKESRWDDLPIHQGYNAIFGIRN
jgi:tRNA (adenine37-N6)-methyltransferase